jgi:hypothetical protein
MWTEGTGWKKGGSLAYRLYDPAGHPSEAKKQLAVTRLVFRGGIATPDNTFSIVY